MEFRIGGKVLSSRLFIGSGKYGSNALIPRVVENCGTQVITLAIRRIDVNGLQENMMDHIPDGIILLPNTSGARNAEEAVRIARIGRATGCGDWVKIEIIPDNKYLLPDNQETIRAIEILAKEGFQVFPYMSPDLVSARRMRDAGAVAVMPLGSPIGSNRGLRTEEMVQILIDEIDLPIIVDAGIGRPSEAARAMEMGAAACLVNTAIASAADPVRMGAAFGAAVRAGRDAYLAGLGAVSDGLAEASSPLTGFLG